MIELIIVSIIIISVLIGFRKYQLNKLLSNPSFLEKVECAKDFLSEIRNRKLEYFTHSILEKIKTDYKILYTSLSNDTSLLKKSKEESLTQFFETYKNLDNLVKDWNSQYIKKELEANKDFFSDIDDKSLDDQQRTAVVVDEDNNLVIAGAGSGKTLTIAGKVKYLVEKKNINPEDILLISFTKKAADEMQERITQKLHIGVDAMTFHKLGLDIISREKGYRPDVFQDIGKVIDEYLTSEILNDKQAITQIVTFFGYYLNIAKDMEEFENLGEAHDYYRNIDFETLRSKVYKKSRELKNNKITIQGENVRSMEEVTIANFLYLNGINYEYETEYPFPSNDPYRKKYRPDFYLPDYDIYLEHFGITKDYKVPWLSEIEEKKYLEGIEWKRTFHEENDTLLLETYSYFNKDGVLLTELEKMLKAYGVDFKSIDYNEVYQKLFSDGGDRYFSEFKKLIQTFIGLFKSKGYSDDSFQYLHRETRNIENEFLRKRTEIFLSIVQPIYGHYQQLLEDSNRIDFNDMINLATEIVKEGETGIHLKYIIIDEYQDISVSRFGLIQAIKDQTDAKILCVGDDWQSIYRFAGSDIDLFTSFEDYFGYSELLKIENTYRNSQELINIAGKFIMSNPKQIRKDLRSAKHHSNPVRIIGYDRAIMDAFEKAIEEIVYLNGEQTEVMILGRNNFDINILEEDKRNMYKVNRNEKQVKITFKKYPKLKLFFLTAHRSKGLEAENVIVINLENKLVGFPNKISDDPVLSLVLTDLDSFSYAEERRLFYVALTRTKNGTYLLAPQQGQSFFVEELIKKMGIEYDFSTDENPITNNPNCPRCQKGFLVLREHNENKTKFLGCNNYPLCDNTFKQIELLKNYIICPKCSGYMVKRKGKYGEFYGCTNYPFCKNILNIDKNKKFYKN